MKSALDTPMMRQYLAIKANHPDAILFYRMGDFYEMFLRDAEIAAPLLDIALTTRDKGKRDAVPMCGIPVHAADPHVKKLAELGYRVAICEQVEDAREAAGRRLVKRDVVEVVTPGLAGDPEGIEAAAELALVALDPGAETGFAVLDASTGDFRATQVPRGPQAGELPGDLADELRRVAPRELLVPLGTDDSLCRKLEALLPDTAITRVDGSDFDPSRAPAHPDGLVAGAADPSSRAAAALLAYVGANQPFALAQVGRLRRYGLADAMVLDASTQAHLELFRNSEDGSRRRTLVEQIDRTRTPLGARRLARWLAYPLLSTETIARRQDAVAWLAEHDRPRGRLREALREVRDLERIFAKAARPGATPRDLAALRGSLEALPAVRAAQEVPSDELLPEATAERPPLLAPPEPVPQVAGPLREALVDDPPAVPRGSRGAGETGYVRDGFHSELDGLREAVRKGREWIAGLEAKERERTGIATLKIRFHPVHGYSMEVTKAHLARVPEDFERKQTLANAERFTTPELREVEGRVRGAGDRAAALEREIFEKVRRHALEFGAPIRAAAEAVGRLDALTSLAEVARLEAWVRPDVHEGESLEIRAGRHPVVEPLLAAGSGEEFVPNDAALDPQATAILLLTGPNMSGKSTYLRQVALIVLLAQMGSFVPAESARIGVVDRVFTRVGASDRLARGESTFMVEMRETAEILSAASRRSLVILDEIGRGTSTFDGLSIAWAVAEYLHDTPGLCPRTLFATHYHELTDLAQAKEHVGNAHFEAREWGEDVIFLRRLVAGGASRSYGIQVARLAGLPALVIERARELLRNLEGGEYDAQGRPRLAAPPAPGEPDDQLGLFAAPAADPAEAEVLAALREVDPERTTPLDALTLLSTFQRRLRGAT
ncbi:MAG: DNA mismatch repair protein MutS [Myxococcota bacterium]|nr:DNA mismatch repair protein MutS [Myxococcota bacterium]